MESNSFDFFSAVHLRESMFSNIRWGLVQRQPCARNDHLAQGRPHMALIWFHFSFIPPWQNNGRLWRLSYPLLFLSPRPKCLSLHRATLRPCAKGQTEISCTHIGLWLNPTSAFLLIVLDEGRRNRAGDPAVKTLRHFKIFGNWN